MLEHFPSWEFMIVFDVVFLCTAVVATVIFVLRFTFITRAEAFHGTLLLLIGIWLIAALYALDLFAMVVLPPFIGEAQSMEIMRDVHVSYAWYITFAAQMALIVGLVLLIERLRHQHDHSVELTGQLTAEIGRKTAAELELRESERRLSQATEVAQLGYYLWDAVDDNCLYCSETHARFHGLTPAEYIRTASALDGSFQLTAEEDRERVRLKYLELRSGTPISMEYQVFDGTNMRRLREIAKPIFDAEGRLYREAGTTLDITDQHHAELRLRKAQQFELVGKLTGGVAHDFNNILAVIMGNLELIEAMDDPRKAHELVTEAIESTVRGAELTRSLLSFARKATLNPEEIDLGRLVERTRNWVSRTIPESIRIEFSKADGLWAINADRVSVENALINLIINARDAMEDGGTLTIETLNVDVTKGPDGLFDDGIRPGSYVLLAVSDTGTGIAPALQEQIFEPFYTTKPDGTGSGLGLSTIQGFMAQSGGAVRVYSEVAVGTTFKLYFPALDAGGRAAIDPARSQRPLVERTLRILIAEDDSRVREMILSQLELAGHNVVAKASGDSAADHFLTDDAFDLVITDVVMPGELQGPNLVKKLRESRSEIPAIFISGYPSEATVHGNGLRREDIKLLKPVRRNELLLAIDKACGAAD